MVSSQVILVMLAAVGVFTIAWRLVRGILTSEWFNEIYIKPILQRSLGKAYSQEKQAQIDQEYYKFKLAQLLAKTYKERELALDYFDNVPPDPRLVEKLMEILPKQHRKNIQQRMASLLEKTLKHINGDTDEQSGQWKEATAKEWSIAIAIWLTEILSILALWLEFINCSLTQGQIFFIAGVLFIVTIFALKFVIKDWHRFGKVTLVTIALLLGGLYIYSKVTHAGITTVEIPDLAYYGITGVEISINYPTWLTAEDIETNKKVVSMRIKGNNTSSTEPLTISFDYQWSILKVTNENGKAISPSFKMQMTNPDGAPHEFSLKPVSLNILRIHPRVEVKTEIKTKTIKKQEIKELNLHINLENPIWKTLRDIFLYLGSFSFTSGIFWFIWERMKR